MGLLGVGRRWGIQGATVFRFHHRATNLFFELQLYDSEWTLAHVIYDTDIQPLVTILSTLQVLRLLVS